MAFDLKAARAAGYSDDEIADFLATESGFDTAGARKAGYSSSEIVDGLAAELGKQKPLPAGVEPARAGPRQDAAMDPRRTDAPVDRGLIGTMSDSLARGVPSLMQGFSGTGLRANAGILGKIDEVEQKLAAGKKPETFTGDEDPYGLAWMSPEQRAAFRAQSTSAATSQAASITAAEATKADYPAPPVVDQVMKAKTWGEALSAFAGDPLRFVAAIGPESLVTSAPGLIGAALAPGGAAAKVAVMGAGSGATDYGSQIISGLQRSGVDLSDPQAVLAASKDAELMRRIAGAAMAHAGPVAALDAASGGVASKMLVPAKALAKSPLAREAANVAAQLPAQGVAGGAGEVLGAVASGQEIEPGNVLAEMVGEGFSAPAEIGAVGGKAVAARLAAPAAPAATNFTEPDSPSAQAGLTPIVVPVPAAEPMVPGDPNVGVADVPGAVAGGGGDVGGAVDAGGVAAAGRDPGQPGELRSVPEAASAPGAEGAPVRGAAEERPGALNNPARRAGDAELLAAADAESAKNEAAARGNALKSNEKAISAANAFLEKSHKQLEAAQAMGDNDMVVVAQQNLSTARGRLKALTGERVALVSQGDADGQGTPPTGAPVAEGSGGGPQGEAVDGGGRDSRELPAVGVRPELPGRAAEVGDPEPARVRRAIGRIEDARLKLGEAVKLEVAPPAGRGVDLAAKLSRAFGIPTVFVRAKSGKAKFIAAHVDGINVLRADHSELPLAAAAHEVVHGLPDDIKAELIAAVKPTFRNVETFKRDFGYTDKVDEELTAVLAQQQSKTPEFWRDLRSKMGDSSFARLADAVIAKLDKLIKGLRKEDLGEFTTDVQKVRDAITTAYAKAAVRRGTAVDAGAQQAATSTANDLEQPTDAQKKAGNYKVGRARVAGLDISIENPEGSVRSGTSPDGKAWRTEMKDHYGYIRGTVGRDKDHIDVFIKPGTDSEFAGSVWVVDQRDPSTGEFDEHKVVMGAASEEEARSIYARNYSKGWEGLGSITEMTADGFKEWLASGDTMMPADSAFSEERDGGDKHLLENWLKGSKVRKTVYHGTSGNFTHFDASRQGQTAGVKGGFFFTSSKRVAGDVYGWREGGRVLGAKVNIKNPLGFAEYFRKSGKNQLDETNDGFDAPVNYFDNNSDDVISFARSHGYDGIVWPADPDSELPHDLIVVFDADQIRVLSGDAKSTPKFSERRADFTDPEERREVSTTRPKPAKGRDANSYDQKWVISGEDVKSSKTHVEAIAKALRAYNTLSGNGDASALMQELHDTVVENLLWLHDLVPAGVRARAKLWYDGANRIATDWTRKYGISERQASGVLAVLSPQMDWFKNVSLAERVINVWKERQAEPWSQAMTDWVQSWVDASKTADEKTARSRLLEEARTLQGKALYELTDADAAKYVRVFDETYHERSYRLVTPEGGFGDYVTKADDGESAVTWGGFKTIEKAISILNDGSFRNVDAKLGDEHKVRNFFNNIASPNSGDGHVTIDTHAVAAALVKALSGSTKEVSDNFGAAGSTAATGAGGTYALFADAYRDAAAQRGILAREMQSITWEAVRSLFPASIKDQLAPQVDAVWDRFRKGEITRDQARKEVFKLSGGIRPMAWEGGDTGKGAADGGTSFNTEIDADPAKRAARRLEPVAAKDSIAVTLSASTMSIPGLAALQERASKGDAYAHQMLQDVALDALRHLLGGTSARIKADRATGLYGGSVEPSLGLSITFTDTDRPAVLAGLAKFGENFNQEQIHVRGGTKHKAGHAYEDGSYSTPVYRWQLDKALDRKAVQRVIDRSGLYGLTFGDDFVEAYYVGDPNDEQAISRFQEGAERANVALGKNGSAARREAARLWAYGRGDSAIGYERIRGDVAAGPIVSSDTARRVAEYLNQVGGKPGRVRTFAQAADLSPEQAALQRRIAAAYEALPDNDLQNPRVRRAYQELTKEVVRQFKAMPIKVEVFTGTGEPYKSSADMRRDVLDNNHLFIFGTTPATFGPEGADFSGHPLLADTGLKDVNGYALLGNDLLRAVHDYFAHNLSETQFGPRGEEAAWKNHMASTTNPWARWALTSETRGQNSWVNFNPAAEGVPVKERPFARQKAALLPAEYSLTGDRAVDAPMKELIAALPVAQRVGSKPVRDVEFSEERRPYGAAPDNLMGFRKSKPNTPFDQQKYKHVEFVRVTWGGGNTILDAQRGLNKAHAIERARRNWSDAATIEAVPREIVAKEDPELVQSVDHAMDNDVDFANQRRRPGAGYGTQLTNAFGFPLDDETRTQKFRRFVQDYFLRVKTVQDAVLRGGGIVDERRNVYEAEARMYGRVQEQLLDFSKDWVEPMLDRAAKAGIDLDELALYAYAKHAPERNAYIDSINPKLQGKGSGMTDADAAAVVARIPAGKLQQFEDLRQDLLAITETTRRVLLDEGLITQEEYDAWTQQYQDYVPLRGFDVVDDETGTIRPGSGRGFNVRGKESLKALGRASRAGDIIENVVRDYQRAVIRAERNAVGKVFLDLVTSNPDPTLWEVDSKTPKRSMNRLTGMVALSMETDKGPDTVAVKVGGREVYITVHDELLLRAMRKASVDESGQMQRALAVSLGAYNDWMRNTLTRYNPVFGLTNALKDVQTGAVSALDELGAAGAAKYATYYRAAMAASFRNETRSLGKAGRFWGDPAMDKAFEEFKAAGGTTGGWFLRDPKEIERDLRQIMVAAGASPRTAGERITGSKAWQGAKAALRYVELFGAASENASRMAAYRAARDMGRTPAQAASIAKNLTTNFNRKGEWGTGLNSLYLFFNAAVQGTARTLSALKSPKVQALMAGVTATAAALALANAEMGGDDDDGEAFWDKIPDHEKERSLIIMLPPGEQLDGANRVGKMGRYLKLPLPYGFNIFPVLGYQMADVGRYARNRNRGVSPAKAAINMVSAVAGSYNPVGGSFDLTDPIQVAMAASPTIVDAGIQLGAGVNNFGRPVGPRKGRDDTKPDSETFTPAQAGTPSQKLARWMNSVTGGNEARSGRIDVMPGTLDNAVRLATGGVGVFLRDVFINMPTKLVDPEATTRARDVPFLRNLFGQVDENVDRGLFYERTREVLDEARTALNEMKLGVDVKYDERSRGLQALGKVAQSYTGVISDLRKEELRIVDDPDLTADQKKAARRDIESRRNEFVRQFNELYLEKMADVNAGLFKD